jgi:hypothetical protein
MCFSATASFVTVGLTGSIGIVSLLRVTEPRQLALAYLAATCLPPILSTWRTVATLGLIVLVGCVVAYEVYWEAFASVWCFFAAAASAVILGHFEQSRWRHLRTVQV